MPFHAVVTVDLDNGVSSASRTKFNDELKKNHFTKHKLTTLWTALYTVGVTRERAVEFARECIDDAAAAAGIVTYEAFVSISEAPPVEWKKNAVNPLVAGLMRFQK
jgi:nucleoid-associated protein YgaU